MPGRSIGGSGGRGSRGGAAGGGSGASSAMVDVFFDEFTSAKLVIFVKSKKPKKHNDLKNSEKFKTKVHF